MLIYYIAFINISPSSWNSWLFSRLHRLLAKFFKIVPEIIDWLVISNCSWSLKHSFKTENLSLHLSRVNLQAFLDQNLSFNFFKKKFPFCEIVVKLPDITQNWTINHLQFVNLWIYLLGLFKHELQSWISNFSLFFNINFNL